MSPNPNTYFIQTYGCQMNIADSAGIASGYEAAGWQKADNPKEADEVVVNTCSVRHAADNRAIAFVQNLSPKTYPLKPKVIVTGCILRLPPLRLKKLLPEVDEFRPLSDFVQNNQIKIAAISTKSAFVPISNGCNNFCSYCVVPYARGREASRDFAEIVCEVETYVKRGVTDITLLGQNVNSYGKDFAAKKATTFAQLITTIHAIPGLSKISFLTSNPWDFTDDLIAVLALPKIDHYLHLPVQSGDNEILRRMNRHYTREDYLTLVTKIKTQVPEITIGTDIIVGFPGETESQFNNTLDLCCQVGFAKAYVAIYSPRSGTAAYKLKDDVPFTEKRRRWKILDQLINH